MRHHPRCPKDMDPMWGQCACDVIDGLLADLRAWVGTHAFDYAAQDTGIPVCRHDEHRRAGWSATCPKAWVRKELPRLFEEAQS